MGELIEFHQEFLAQIKGDADAHGLITTDAFLEKTGELLEEAGEVSALTHCYHESMIGKKALQVDAYAWDADDRAGVLNLVVLDFDQGPEPGSLDKNGVARPLDRLVQFVMAAADREKQDASEWREALADTSEAYVLVDLIRRKWKAISKIKLILITNKRIVARSDAKPVGNIGGVPVTANVWGLERIRRFVEAGQTREDLVIDFDRDFGEPIPVLKASAGDGQLESYIAVIRGSQLAAIYDRWEARLLEANVRSFLQARGKVNRGIRDTITNEPAMFFSYNNGLTTTAEAVEVADLGEGLFLMSAENFQIVNGGQTTASIHALRKTAKEELENLYVQMKLTVVPKEESERVVPLISQFANSQNKVNAADFFANHPFHIQMEEFSRRILTPVGDTQYRESKWFYERARGQFADERGRRTIGERKSFDAMFPKTQFFTKTDLAKFENSFRCRPHIVSYGAQKNFADLAKAIGEEWGRSDGARFDELWFQRLIAKGLVFRGLERIVGAQEWYPGGYRANIVTYGIAKLVHDAAQLGKVIDLDAVWRMQRVHVELEAALLVAAEAAARTITAPLERIQNNTEWAKKEACWTILSKQRLTYGDGIDAILVSAADADAVKRGKRREAAQDGGIEAQSMVVGQGGDYWAQWLAFGQAEGRLNPKEEGILRACTMPGGRMPTEKQCSAALDIAERLHAHHQSRSSSMSA